MPNLDILHNHPPSPIEDIRIDPVTSNDLRLLVKRDDLLTVNSAPAFCGNKWRKLKYNLSQAQKEGYSKLLTFGGAYSNHITATAAAGQLFGFKTIGCIRGEERLPLNPSLAYARECGMVLQYLDRTTFRNKKEPSFLQNIREEFGRVYLLPEGGTNELAVKGCRELVTEIKEQISTEPDYYCLSCGTGGTMTGLIAELEGTAKVIGFSALKGNFLANEVECFLKEFGLPSYQNWQIQTNYHFGGYARHRPELIDFINDFKDQTGILLDPIYTGKLFYGVMELIREGFFPKGSTIMAIHTGGLQGIAGFNQRYGPIIKN